MATKQLNKRLVVILTLIGFAGMILLSVLMLRRLQQRDPKYFVDLAEASAKQQQWQQAALFYTEAASRGGEAKYLVEAGEMHLRDGEVGRALGVWRHALVEQPDLVDGHVRQLTLLLQLGRLYGTPQRWEQVRDAAERLLEIETNRTDEQSAFGNHALGQALISLENQTALNAERGLAALVEATRLAPEVVEYSTGLALQLSRRDKHEEAERVYRQAVERHETPGAGATQARIALAKYLSDRQRMDEAESVFQEAMKFAETDGDALQDAKLGYSAFLTQRWARAMFEHSKETADPFFAEAEQVLKDCIAARPEAFEPYLQMAILYKTVQRHNDVVEVCEQRIRRGMSRKGVEATQNRISMFTLMIYASEACVAAGLKASEAGDTAGRDQWLNRADQYVADAKGESAAHPRIMSQAGRVKLARGLDREALVDLRAADEAYGTYDAVNWENKIILAQVHLRLNEAGAAKAVLDRVLDQANRYRGRDPIFWNLFAQVLLLNNELDRALTICDRVLLFDSNNSEAGQIKAAIYERQGKHLEAARLYEKATGSPTIRALLEARAAALAEDVDGAVRILRKALETDPADSRLVATTVNELVRLNRHEDAQAVVERAVQIKPEDAQFKKLAVLARRDLADDERDRAMLNLIELEADAFQRDLDLVVFHSRKQDLAEAIQALDRAEQHVIAKDTPLARTATSSQHAALLKTKIRAGAQLNDEPAMAAARDAAAKYNVDGAGGKSLLGWYHLQRKELELALNAFREAIEAQPTDATLRAHMGQCFQLLGRIDEARAAYEEAVRVNPNEAFAHQGLALMAQSRGDKEAFQRELGQCERLLPSDPWVQEQLLIRTEEVDPRAAIHRREGKLAEAPDDARNLQRLATLYETVGDRTRAEKSYSRLLELKPDDEQVVLTASTFYRRTDRPEKALELVVRFAKTRANPAAQANAQMYVANEYIQEKRLPEGEEALLAGLRIAETPELLKALGEYFVRAVREPAKAIPWYQKAIDQGRTAKAPNLPSLLEAKIACLLDRSVNQVDQARHDVNELRTSFPDYARGWLWVSEIEARNGNIDRAVEALTSYLAKRPDDAYALYQRARHHVSRGRISAAVADLEAAKRTSPTALDLQPRLYLTSVHLRAGRRDLWLTELESLVRDAPTSATAIEALARAYIQEKRYADADRIVTAEINRDGTSPDPRWFFLRGDVSLELGQAEKAYSDYRRGAEVSEFSPNGVLQVLSVFLRTGRFAEGVEYFQRHGDSERTTAEVVSKYAQLSARNGNKVQAVEAFRRAMALAMSESTQAVQIVARDALAVFEAEEAIAAFAGAPGDPAKARANDRLLIRFYTATNRFDDALGRLEALAKSAADDAERAVLFHEKGDIEQTANQPEQAIASYRMAMEKDPNNWITLNNIAYLLSDVRKENAEALPFALRAVARSETENAFALDTLGWIYVGLGRFSEAVAELSRAIRVQPEYPLPYYHLGEAYRRNAQFSEATNLLGDGRALAVGLKDDEVLNNIDASLKRVEQRDASP